METDDDDATTRERFALVQSILFIDFTDILPAHFQEKMVEKLWGNYAIWFGFFDNGLCRELMVSLVIQGGFFDCSALKMTKCRPLKEISELFLPKND